MTPRQATACKVLWNLTVLAATCGLAARFRGPTAAAIVAIGIGIGRWAIVPVPDDDDRFDDLI